MQHVKSNWIYVQRMHKWPDLYMSHHVLNHTDIDHSRPLPTITGNLLKNDFILKNLIPDQMLTSIQPMCQSMWPVA